MTKALQAHIIFYTRPAVCLAHAHGQVSKTDLCALGIEKHHRYHVFPQVKQN